MASAQARPYVAGDAAGARYCLPAERATAWRHIPSCSAARKPRPTGTAAHGSQRCSFVRTAAPDEVLEGDSGTEQSCSRRRVVLLVISDAIDGLQSCERRRAPRAAILVVRSGRGYEADRVARAPHARGKIRLLGVQEETLIVPVSNGLETIRRHQHRGTAGPCCIALLLI